MAKCEHEGSDAEVKQEAKVAKIDPSVVDAAAAAAFAPGVQ